MLAKASDSSAPTTRNQPIERRLSWGNLPMNTIALGATIQIDTAENGQCHEAPNSGPSRFPGGRAHHQAVTVGLSAGTLFETTEQPECGLLRLDP